MCYGPQSARILAALQWLRTTNRQTRFARILCARYQGHGGFQRFCYLNGNYDNGQAMIIMRSWSQTRS